MTATDVQAAIDEIEDRVDDIEDDFAKPVWMISATAVASNGAPTSWTPVDCSAIVPAVAQDNSKVYDVHLLNFTGRPLMFFMRRLDGPGLAMLPVPTNCVFR